MVNSLGPGLTGDNATASRPAHVPTGSGSDLWFQDCSSEAAKDGTRVRAQWLNMMMAQLREAIRGMGVAESETDDTMLLKCFQKLQFSNWLNLPIYPEILEGGNVLSVTDLGGGSLRVAAGQSFLHRGWNKVETNDYTDGERTVATVASKTYHLRWQYNSGSPIFVLKDTSDAVYNPGALSESNAAFDSTYDDMLIAKIVTNGSNVPTITSLINAAVIEDRIYSSGGVASSGANGASRTATVTYNWARVPKNFSIELHTINTGVGSDPNWPYNVSADHDMQFYISAATRYSTSAFIMYDYAQSIAVDIDLAA